MNEIEAFENRTIKEFRANFRENVDTEFDELKIIIQELIENKNYEKIIQLILDLEEWPEQSGIINLMKMEWWREFLEGNMHENSEKKIQLIGIKGETLIFNSTEELYKEYIKKKNSEIWEIHNKAFTKIFVEFLVDAVIDSLEKVSNKIEFINYSLSILKKREIKDKYFLNEFSVNLNYYKEILKLIDEKKGNQSEINDSIDQLKKDDKIHLLKQALIDKNYEEFFKIIKVIYSSIPYQLFTIKESYFHSIFHVCLILINNLTTSEDISNLGRGDTIVITKANIFIFELKMTNAEEAINQIHQKRYYGKYIDLKKDIELIGVAFDEEIKNISEYKCESYDSSTHNNEY